MKWSNQKREQNYTSIIGTKKISKNHPTIEVLGCLDELIAFLGLAIAAMDAYPELKQQCIRIQIELSNLSAIFANYTDIRTITIDNVKSLEKEILEMNQKMPSVNTFVLPRESGECSARLNICRTICRRAERAIVELAETQKLGYVEIPYINCLSNWLFVASRFATYPSRKET